MKKALRVGYHLYHDETAFAEHLALVQQNVRYIDEITIFTELSHYGYWDLPTCAQNAALLADRIAQYRSVGIKSVGLNVISTIGHIEEGFDLFPKAPFPYMMNEAGEPSRSCLCPSSEAYLDYIAKRYALYTATGADFIWLDDDIRPNNHGVVKGHCFCPGCIGKFNREYSFDYSARTLSAALPTDPVLSRQWDDFADSVLEHLCAVIRQTVKRENPNTEIGFMSVSNVKRQWLSACGATKGRPGGGFYIDEAPVYVFGKINSVQKQILTYPQQITDIQYEYEAFNYQSLEKSKHISELESTLSLMSGCNGVLYNSPAFLQEQDWLDVLKGSANKWEILTGLNTGCRNTGVYCITPHMAWKLNESSIPTTFSPDHAVAAFVIGDEWNQLTDRQIKAVLQKNVLTDGPGLSILHRRGFGDQCGGTVKTVHTSSMSECFADHPYNGTYKQFHRDIYMNFHFESNAFELSPDPHAQCLSYLENITRTPLGCSCYLWERPDGTRFAADGYLMPNQMKTAAKRHQVMRIMDWLAAGQLPIIIEKSVKVIPLVTTDGKGGMTVMLTNASFDPTGSIACILRSNRKFAVLEPDGSFSVPHQQIENGECKITLPNIPGWNYCLLTNQNTTVFSK